MQSATASRRCRRASNRASGAIPGGRPRGARNWKTLLAEALDRRVLVTGGGKRRRIAKCELGIIRLADRRAARSGRSGAWLAG
jgi:hypothetical protein